MFPCVTEKCQQVGYPVPVLGNDLCPSREAELQCTSQVTESQLAEGTFYFERVQLTDGAPLLVCQLVEDSSLY